MLCIVVHWAIVAVVFAAPWPREAMDSQSSLQASDVLEHAPIEKRRAPAELPSRGTPDILCDIFHFLDECENFEKKGTYTGLDSLLKKLEKERSLENGFRKLKTIVDLLTEAEGGVKTSAEEAERTDKEY